MSRETAPVPVPVSTSASAPASGRRPTIAPPPVRRTAAPAAAALAVTAVAGAHIVPAATWLPGMRLDSFDKQYVRNWLLHDSGWDRGSGDAPPPLPDEVVERTRARYVEAYQKLTGETFR